MSALQPNNNMISKEGYILILSGLPNSPTLSAQEPSLLHGALEEFLNNYEAFEASKLPKLRAFQQRCYNLQSSTPSYFWIKGKLLNSDYNLGVELRKGLLLFK